MVLGIFVVVEFGTVVAGLEQALERVLLQERVREQEPEQHYIVAVEALEADNPFGVEGNPSEV